jgi:hypothetical protein
MVKVDRAGSGLQRAGSGPDLGRVGLARAQTRVARWCGHVVGPGPYWAFGSPGTAHRGLACAVHGPKTGSWWAQFTAPFLPTWSTVDQAHTGTASLSVSLSQPPLFPPEVPAGDGLARWRPMAARLGH